MPTDCIIYVVDDDPSVRKSLTFLLDSAGYATQAFSSADEFMEGYDPQVASCLLLDVRMPNSNGLELQSMLDVRQVSIPIIFISGHVDVRTASKAFRAGACDVLTKPVDAKLLMERVEEALEKDRQHRQSVLSSAAKEQLLSKLTPKEREVFQELLKGRTIKQLATHFAITFQTAAKHRARVLEKIGVETDAQLVQEFQEFATA
ncbi:MAG: response regulator transcription factor [Bythopirellula sp.]